MLVVADLWWVPFSLNFVSVLNRPIQVTAVVISLNLFSVYLVFDFVLSLVVLLVLYLLTCPSFTDVIPLVSWCMHNLGMILIGIYYCLDLPFKAVSRLIKPIIDHIIRYAKAHLTQHKGFAASGMEDPDDPFQVETVDDLFKYWREGMHDTKRMVGVFLLGGMVFPYLAILTCSSFLNAFAESQDLSAVAQGMLTLLSYLSDLGGVMVFIALLLNMLFWAFPETQVGQALVNLVKQLQER